MRTFVDRGPLAFLVIFAIFGAGCGRNTAQATAPSTVPVAQEAALSRAPAGTTETCEELHAALDESGATVSSFELVNADQLRVTWSAGAAGTRQAICANSRPWDG